MTSGRSERTPENAAAFCEALAETGHIGKACQLAGLSRGCVYGWRAADTLFAAEWDEALQRGMDALEDEAMRRAKDGAEHDVYYKGEVCGVRKEYSDLLTIFLLKGNRPEKYADRAKVEHSGAVAVRTVSYAEALEGQLSQAQNLPLAAPADAQLSFDDL